MSKLIQFRLFPSDQMTMNLTRGNEVDPGQQIIRCGQKVKLSPGQSLPWNSSLPWVHANIPSVFKKTQRVINLDSTEINSITFCFNSNLMKLPNQTRDIAPFVYLQRLIHSVSKSQVSISPKRRISFSEVGMVKALLLVDF